MLEHDWEYCQSRVSGKFQFNGQDRRYETVRAYKTAIWAGEGPFDPAQDDGGNNSVET